MFRQSRWFRPIKQFIAYFLFSTVLTFCAPYPRLIRYQNREGFIAEFPEFYGYFERIYLLNEPILTRYLEYLRRIVTLDFGVTLEEGIPIIELLTPAILASLQILIASGMLSLLIGIPLGIWWGYSRSRIVNALFYSISILLRSLLPFVAHSFAIWGIIYLGPTLALFDLFRGPIIIGAAVYPSGAIMRVIKDGLNTHRFENYISKWQSKLFDNNSLWQTVQVSWLALWRERKRLFLILCANVAILDFFTVPTTQTVGYYHMMGLGWDEWPMYQAVIMIIITIWLLLRMLNQYVELLSMQKSV